MLELAMLTEISKAAALAAYDGNTGALAHALGVTVQAIYQWPDDEPIPQARQWQLAVLRPEIFGAEPSVPAKVA